MQMVTTGRTKAASAPSQERGKSGMTAWREGQCRALTLKDAQDFDSCGVPGGISGLRKEGEEEDAGCVQIYKMGNSCLK